MMKWTLNRGSEEHSIVASGTDYHLGFEKMFTVIGTTGALERGRVRVDLKMTYITDRSGISMMGYFDLEENSLKGRRCRMVIEGNSRSNATQTSPTSTLRHLQLTQKHDGDS
jgi:hypothetical protein